MITGILFERFQSIVGPCRVGLRDLTFLYGPNSAGKSSVVDAFRLFKSVTALNMGDLDFSGAPIRKGTQESLSVGLELIFDSKSRIDDTDTRRKERYEDGVYDSDFEEKKFFDSLKQKPVCFKITAGGSPADDDCLEIFIDQILFVKVSNEPSFFDPCLNLISAGEALDNQDPIYGYIYINKQVEGFKWLDLWSTLNLGDNRVDAAIYKFFENEDDEKIEIRGLDFQLLATEPFWGTRLLAPQFTNDDHLSGWTREDFSRFARDFYQGTPESELELIKEKNDKFLSSISQDAKHRDASINSSLWRLSDKLSLLIESFLLRISAELTFTSVPGARSIIDSSSPLRYDRQGNIEEKVTHGRHESIPRYFQNSIWPLIGWERDKGIGIVDAALGRLMPSLGRYSIQPLISKSERVPSSWELDPGEQTIFTDETGYSLGEGFAVFPYLSSNSMRNTAINFKDIGSGVSFVFPILTAVENTFLTIVEQPELHLHPRAQCEIGDVFIYAINHNRKMVVESHSEHILLRISRRIRENSRGALIAKDLKLRPDQVIIHYFKPNGDGTTTIFPIRFDQQGDFLDLWPDGFFAERDSEIFDE